MNVLVKFLVVEDNVNSDLVLICKGNESVNDIKNTIEGKINTIIKIKYIKF